MRGNSRNPPSFTPLKSWKRHLIPHGQTPKTDTRSSSSTKRSSVKKTWLCRPMWSFASHRMQSLKWHRAPPSQTTVLSNAKDSIYGIGSVNENLKLVDKITAQDIQNAANYIFSGKSLTSVLASQKTIDNMNLG